MTPESDPPPHAMYEAIVGAESAFLKGKRKKQADLESAVAIFLEFLKGFELFDIPGP